MDLYRVDYVVCPSVLLELLLAVLVPYLLVRALRGDSRAPGTLVLPGTSEAEVRGQSRYSC
jgi:hypothetical protein